MAKALKEFSNQEKQTYFALIGEGVRPSYILVGKVLTLQPVDI